MCILCFLCTSRDPRDLHVMTHLSHPRRTAELLGQTLVERTRRVVRFTTLGNAIVEKAHRVLREAEELADMAAAAAAPLVGELRMSVIPTIAPFLLPDLLPRLRKERPSLKLFLDRKSTRLNSSPSCASRMPSSA